MSVEERWMYKFFALSETKIDSIPSAEPSGDDHWSISEATVEGFAGWIVEQ